MTNDNGTCTYIDEKLGEEWQNEVKSFLLIVSNLLVLKARLSVYTTQHPLAI